MDLYIPKQTRKRRKKNRTPPCHKLTIASDKHEQFHLGEICIGLIQNVLLPKDWNTCSATFIPPKNTAMGQMEGHILLTFDTTRIVPHIMLDFDVLKEIIVSKIFAFRISLRLGQLFFDLYCIELPLPKFNNKLGYLFQNIFALLYKVSIDLTEGSSDQSSSRQEIAQFYKNIKKVRDENLQLNNQEILDPRLKPLLRPYQEQAIRWMLYREKQEIGDQDELHPLYTPIILKSGQQIYFDKYSGYLTLDRPIVTKPAKGGILADEMGLGKTVEVLACILLHQKHPKALTGNHSPIVEKLPSKKHKLPPQSIPDAQPEPKKIKVPEEWVKKSTKTPTRLALEKWYESRLDEVKVNKTVTLKPKKSVKCICGGTDQEGVVSCQDCDKIQHASCLGYKKQHGEYRCPQCWVKQPLLESGVTLIVTPIALRTQWTKEICKHVKGDFKVLQYMGYSNNAVYPAQLLEYDVVITTYNVLQAELRLTETSERDLPFRNERRYSAPGSPLTRINWWRLCLDEAQTVDVPTTMVAAMAQKLTAQYRWAVTGTPISKEISDLYGLIEYLHMEPYNDPETWKHVLFDPFLKGDTKPLYEFLSQVLWRSSKDDISNQINIPKQTVEEHGLDFSAVEQFFYKCEHKSNKMMFFHKRPSIPRNTTLQSLNKSDMKKILAPLLSLRQVCTYPNSASVRYLSTKKTVNSMEDLLEALIAKNCNESEDFLRIVLSAFNGLAGVYVLCQSQADAVYHYRQVLQLYTRFTAEEKVAKLNVDKLQVIHAMHNLAEILDSCDEGMAERTLRDENLRRDCLDLEHKYIAKFINQSMVALQDTLLLSNNVDKLQNAFVLPAGTWYSDLLDFVSINDCTEELIQKIETAHNSADVFHSSKFRDYKRLLFAIETWDELISDLRVTAQETVNDLYTHCPEDEFKIITSKELVQKAADCHLRPLKKSRVVEKCRICFANENLKAYEMKLYFMNKEDFKEMLTKDRAKFTECWRPTPEELILRSLLALGKSKNVHPDLIKDGETHLNLIDFIKKEFKELRKLWTYLDQQICAQDELDICKIRLQIKQQDGDAEKKLTPILKNLSYNLENRLETIHHLNEYELEYQSTLLESEKNVALSKLEKNLGRRSYLETLHKQQFEGQTPDPCPICKNNLESHWSILPCGHCYCIGCIQSLIKKNLKTQFQCCVCRADHCPTEISYIKPDQNDQDSETTPKEQIKGSYSVKVDAVVKLILDLRSKESDVKILVFSLWIPVLSYLRDALNTNDVSSELVASQNLEKQIEKFKDPKQNITVLLLPINLGSKGLNLIEATHVVLIEPLLNPADELQAIGRVHRIGQTKPTVVHKFFVRNTIEENIRKAVSTDSQNWDQAKVTFGQIIDLFGKNSEEEEEEDL